MATTGKILVYILSRVCEYVYIHITIVVIVNIQISNSFFFIAMDTVGCFHKHNFQKLDNITLNAELYLLFCCLILSLMCKITGPRMSLISPPLLALQL